ncbi:MAG TPA: NAD(P)/FAD-dependent oxidoreductase, partial [Terriglobales bacterium]
GQLGELGVEVRTGTAVDSVEWARRRVEVGMGKEKTSAACALITLPLGVLQAPLGSAGAVRFDPPLPKEKADAMQRLEMGKALRVVLRFRTRFWEGVSPEPGGTKTLSDMGFLLTDDEWFPTWWTTMPKRFPMLTGWAPFRCAEKLTGKTPAFVMQRALETLARLFKISRQELNGWLQDGYVHDWQSDPFSRGAYSYGKVGSDGAQEGLGAPVENTLFFAGEATDTSGHNGTVHGAIASALRAVGEIRRKVKG